jgi:hypothetical protein
MANEYEYEYEDNDYTGTDLVKQLRKQIKELSTENRQLQENLTEYQSFMKDVTVSSVLEENGFDPRIAQFIPDEYADDEEAIMEWLGEYGDMFGEYAIDEDYEDSEYEDSDGDYEYEESYVDSVNRLSDFESQYIDPEVGLDLAAQIQNASSVEELMRITRNS